MDPTTYAMKQFNIEMSTNEETALITYIFTNNNDEKIFTDLTHEESIELLETIMVELQEAKTHTQHDNEEIEKTYNYVFQLEPFLRIKFVETIALFITILSTSKSEPDIDGYYYSEITPEGKIDIITEQDKH